MGKRISKADAETIFQIHAEYICKRFGFGDEEEPTVKVAHIRDAYGEYERRHHRYDYFYRDGSLAVKRRTVRHLITIIPSARFDNDTIVHELAHYVQTMLEKRTCCWDMKAAGYGVDAPDDLCDRHTALMLTIRLMIERRI